MNSGSRSGSNLIRRGGLLSSMGMILLLILTPISAVQDEAGAVNLIELSLVELLNVEIISVANKREEKPEAAAANFVFRHEEIRRSGAASAGDGTEEEGFGAPGSSGKIGARGHFRSFVRFLDRDEGGS